MCVYFTFSHDAFYFILVWKPLITNLTSGANKFYGVGNGKLEILCKVRGKLWLGCGAKGVSYFPFLYKSLYSSKMLLAPDILLSGKASILLEVYLSYLCRGTMSGQDDTLNHPV